MSAERCYHCNEAIPRGVAIVESVGGAPRRFCCPGCRAVAELIDARGLARFYDFRTAPALRPAEHGKAEDTWAVCDRPEVERRLVRRLTPQSSEVRYRVDGVNCAACSWLIDRGLRGLDGVDEVSVNPVSREALVRYDPERVRLSEILAATERFGFEPSLARAGAADDNAPAGRAELKRLAVAGLGFAQVMTLSAALYLGAFKAMETSFTSFFVLSSMLIATPVVLYAGAPIFRAAWADLLRGRAGMDVPVSLAILIALGASVFNALRGSGHVFFDSATMFVFFLTLGRFLESRARHKAGGLFSALADLTPLAAWRRRGERLERVGTIELVVGDIVVVEPGSAVPADGELVSAAGSFDESLLSGESAGRRRSAGETVLGGSLNAGHAPVDIRVTRIGSDSYIERIGSLLHRAMAEKPAFLELADRWASRFVAAVLAATAVAGAIWLELAPERALEVVLAMLVATCPCALSLAAPTAFAVALGRLARRGLLCRSARVLERLGQVDTWLFDKTGTLTEGRMRIAGIEPCADLDETALLAVAAALEGGIEHPIARAIRAAADLPGAADVPIAANVPAAADIEYLPGFGVSGTVAGRRYRLGAARFVGIGTAAADPGQNVYLADDSRVLGRIELADTLRPHAREALDALVADGCSVALVSGDAAAPVSAAAHALGVGEYADSQSPDEKLAGLERRQRGGEVVAAVGDGINDAPLLARADVSVAMMAGSQLAQASADIVFTGNDLRVLAELPRWAAATGRIVRQNLGWAVLYNLAALPLAASGLLAPWMAALGMSLSSLVVVGNALRLNRVLAARRSAVVVDAGQGWPLGEQPSA